MHGNVWEAILVHSCDVTEMTESSYLHFLHDVSFFSISASRFIYAGVEIVEPVSVVRNLGEWIDSELTMHDHVSRTCQSCFFHLRRLPGRSANFMG